MRKQNRARGEIFPKIRRPPLRSIPYGEPPLRRLPSVERFDGQPVSQKRLLGPEVHRLRESSLISRVPSKPMLQQEAIHDFHRTRGSGKNRHLGGTH